LNSKQISIQSKLSILKLLIKEDSEIEINDWTFLFDYLFDIVNGEKIFLPENKKYTKLICKFLFRKKTFGMKSSAISKKYSGDGNILFILIGMRREYKKNDEFTKILASRIFECDDSAYKKEFTDDFEKFGLNQKDNNFLEW
jgi:hypothetical protein